MGQCLTFIDSQVLAWNGWRWRNTMVCQRDYWIGPKACLLAWLPVVGDPLCAVAGWLKFPFWPCIAYMALGKFLRYVTMTAGLLWVFPGELQHFF